MCLILIPHNGQLERYEPARDAVIAGLQLDPLR